MVIETVKESGYKSMTPDTPTFTSRANIRSGPRKIPPKLNNLLDGNKNEDYHQNILLGPHGPYMVRAVAPLKPPPFLFLSIYSDIFSCQVNLI
jgi:hypothetical protein